jgi:hypothetical protein
LKEFALVFELEDLGTDDVRAGVEREDVPDEGFRLSCKSTQEGENEIQQLISEASEKKEEKAPKGGTG